MHKNSLRDLLAHKKQSYMTQDGSVDPIWNEEGLVWAIQEYHGSVGSLIDFTRDDFETATEVGWNLSRLGGLFDEHSRYSLTGYDKDGDCHYQLCDSDNFMDLIATAQNALPALEAGTYRGDDGEP